MKVQSLMKSPVPTLHENMTWKQAAEFFIQHHLSAAPVLNSEEKLVGVLSEKDLFHGLFPQYGDWLLHPETYTDFEEQEEQTFKESAKKLVKDIMVTRMITANPETSILKIGGLMVARGIHQVPVLEHGKVVGMIQRSQIYSSILKKYFDLEKN